MAPSALALDVDQSFSPLFNKPCRVILLPVCNLLPTPGTTDLCLPTSLSEKQNSNNETHKDGDARYLFSPRLLMEESLRSFRWPDDPPTGWCLCHPPCSGPRRCCSSLSGVANHLWSPPPAPNTHTHPPTRVRLLPVLFRMFRVASPWSWQPPTNQSWRQPSVNGVFLFVCFSLFVCFLGLFLFFLFFWAPPCVVATFRRLVLGVVLCHLAFLL